MKLDLLKTLVESPLSRRDFAKKMGITAGGLVGASMLGSTLLSGVTKAAAQESSATASPSATVTDADILNFALNLEYLEAEFYTKAVTGKNLIQAGIIPGSAETGPTTGGTQINFGAAPEIKMIAQQIMDDEQSHVKFLRSALGSGAVKKPTINLNAAGGFTNYKQFLELARDFEDVGVSAYGGAAPLIKNSTYLAAAARIALAEAEHSGVIRLKMVLTGLQEPKVDSQDIPPTWSNLFSLNSSGFAIVRSTSQVLKIVYAGGTNKGGFYPDGFNGTIHTA
jgi:hypothetical protein